MERYGILAERRIISFLGTDTQNARTGGAIYSEIIDKLPVLVRRTELGQRWKIVVRILEQIQISFTFCNSLKEQLVHLKQPQLVGMK